MYVFHQTAIEASKEEQEKYIYSFILYIYLMNN